MAFRLPAPYPAPLPFDNVMEGKPLAARNSPLFRLPLELITHITGFFTEGTDADLASLASVN